MTAGYASLFDPLKLSFFVSIAPAIIPIEKYSTAIRVTLTYKLNKKMTEEAQVSEFGFVFERATEKQRNMVKVRIEI